MEERKKKFLQNVADKLQSGSPECKRVLLGFDGFVDEVVHVVGKRYDAENYERVEYLADYGNMIARSAGVSLNIEMMPIRTKLGGNGTILADSLVHHGVQIDYIGACGKNNIHPVFLELAQKARIFSMSDPGFTDAIEFKDGKIISCKLETLKDVNWENLKRSVGIEGLKNLIAECDMLGFENWTLLIHMSDIWEHILDEVLPTIPELKRKILFIDLADPSKRPEEDIRHAVEMLERFEDYFEVILGLNKKEARIIAKILGAENTEDFVENIEAADYIKAHSRISKVIIHNAHGTCGISKDERAVVDTPYCENPKQTTGAGDNFNAGFLLGQLLEMNLEESLAVGIANSGYYIREAVSADKGAITEFVIKWKDGSLE